MAGKNNSRTVVSRNQAKSETEHAEKVVEQVNNVVAPTKEVVTPKEVKNKKTKDEANKEVKKEAKTESKEKKAEAEVKEEAKEDVKVEGKEEEQGGEDAKKGKKCLELFGRLTELRKQKEELERQEKALMKKFESAYESDMKKAGTKKKRGNTKPTGFVNGKQIGGKLAEFLGVPSGEVLTGPQIAKKFWVKIKELDLVYKGDKNNKKDGRILRTNKEVSDIFGVPKDANKSTSVSDENGFNILNYQKFITYALENNNN